MTNADEIARRYDGPPLRGEPLSPAALVAFSDLTPRQTEVLALLAKGLLNAAIAETLGITIGAASFHVSSACKRVAPYMAGDERRIAAAEWYKANAPVTQSTVELPGQRPRDASDSKELARDCRSRLETAALAAVAHPHPDILREAADWATIVLSLRLVPFPEEVE